VLRTMDRRGFHEQFRDDPTLRALHNKGSSKYIYLERWMREAIRTGRILVFASMRIRLLLIPYA